MKAWRPSQPYRKTHRVSPGKIHRPDTVIFKEPNWPATGNDQMPVTSIMNQKINPRYGIKMYHLHRTKGLNAAHPRRWRKNAPDRRQIKWMRFATAKVFDKERWIKEYRLAKRNVMALFKARRRQRFVFRRQIRQLWIHRLRNVCHLHACKYNDFMCAMKTNRVNLNRKILSQLAIFDKGVASNVFDMVEPGWRRRLKNRHRRQRRVSTPLDVRINKKTQQNVDDMMLPYIEKRFPRLYTDDTIRFNRKVHKWGIQYSIEYGEKKYWQEKLPKSPELANFNFPDHEMERPNEQLAPTRLSLFPWIDKYTPSPEKEVLQAGVTAQEPYELDENGEPIIKDEKPGISRESWFDEEPQSWFD